MAQPLTSKEKKQLRGMAQRLKPSLHLGRSGITATFLEELETALDRDQLVKVRFDTDRETMQQAIEQLSRSTGAECVGSVGRTAAFFRVPEQDRPTL